MKITKRVLTIILSIALVIGGLYFVAPKNAKAEADFAITAPVDASMKGAGAMDIKWEDASAIKPVSSYDVFIDGSLVKNTTDTQYEFYTTKVYFHKVWVRANFTDGTNHYTKTVRFGVTKKGLAVSDDMGRNVDPIELKAGWYYNWGNNPFASSFAGGKYSKLDYVPMIWGDTSPNLIRSRVRTAASLGYKYILGFNEPDIGWQQGGCNMELSRVVELWPNFMGHNIRVGSPAYSLAGIDPSDPEKAAEMFPGFMAAVENNVDHICIHAYPDGWNGGQAMANWLLDDIAGVQHQKYNKPVWITEYSTSGSGITQAGTASFVRYFNEGANSRDYIERHSFFSFNNADRPGLWDYSTGALSQSGANYRDYGNPEEDYVTGPEVNPRDTEPTTEATTTEEPGFGPNKDVPLDEWGTFGEYGVYTGSWDGYNTAKAGVDTNDPYHIVVKKTDNDTHNAWLTQVRITLSQLDASQEYTYTWPIKSLNDQGVVKSSDGDDGDNNTTQLNGGNQTLTGKTEVQNGVVNITVGMGMVDSSNEIEFFYPTVKDSNGQVVFPTVTPTTKAPTTQATTQAPTQAPTTKAPTTKAPTTQAPTQATTQAPTQVPTVEPSTESPTDVPPVTETSVGPTAKPTIAPTAKPSVKPTIKIKKPGKTKIKKAKNKKKRKISLKFKKIKGANGYHIRYSDSKKFDGYWEKYTKKVKVTLKKLDKGTKYYIKARAYKRVNKVIVYGKWSKKKKVKVKK